MNEEEKIIAEVAEKAAPKVKDIVLPAITEEVVKQVSEKIALRKDIFGKGNDGESETEKKQKSAEWLKEKYEKGLTSGGSTAGAELVPTFLSNDFIGIQQNYGLVRRKARKWPIQGMNVTIPTLDTVTAYRIATDGTKITSSKPTTGTLALSTKTVGVIIPVSKRLLKNSSVSLVNALSFLAGKALAKIEDQWGLLGLGAGEGIFQTTGVPVLTLATGKNTYAEIEAEDLLDAMNLVDEDHLTAGNMSWVMSLSLLNVFRGIRAAVGSDKQNFLLGGFGQGIPPTLWDIPYDLSSLMPKTSASNQESDNIIALVNWDDVILGTDENYELEISNQATITDTDGSTLINTFEQEMVAVKITQSLDIKVANPTKSHAIIKTAAS